MDQLEAEINLKIIELNDKLYNQTVISSENKNQITEVKGDIYSARASVHSTEIKALAYTDERIEWLRDLINNTLNNLTVTIKNTAVSDARNITNEAINIWNASWQDKYNIMQEESARAIASAQDLQDWASETINVTIPEILETLDNAVNETNDLRDQIEGEIADSKQDAYNTAGRWRELSDEIQRTIDHIIETDYSEYEEKEQLHTRISKEFEGRFASFDERITTAVGEAGAVTDRISQLEVEYGDQRASLVNVERAMIDGYDELSQQLTSLSVGTGEQFDSVKIWHFDATNEGWVGIWENGYLKVGNSTSISGLDINASRYRQVKMRLKRVGTPSWRGSLNWVGPLEAGPITIDEPNWVNNVAEITVNPEWSGTLNGMTVSFSSGSNASNYILVDWITVGRPSPGASTADLLAERSARISEDAATATRLDSLQASLNNTVGTIAGAATAIEGLQTKVTSHDNTFVVQSEKIVDLESRLNDINLGYVANARAIDLLTTKTSNTDGIITALSNKITVLESSVNSSTASALDQLNTKVETNKNNISIVSNKVTLLESNLAGKANSSALAALTTRVNQTNDKIDVINSDIVSLNSDLKGKANAGALAALTTRVTETERSIETVLRDITSLTTTLNDKASSTAVNLLQTRVKKNEDNISIQSDAITALRSTLNGKAESSVVTAVNTKVETLGGVVRTQGDSITALQSNVGRFNASGLLRITTGASPLGSQSRIMLHAEASSTAATHSAGLMLEAKSDGTSQVIVSADRFAIVNGINGDNPVAPFVISNGVVYLNSITVIRNGDIGTLKIGGNAITVPASGNAINQINLTENYQTVLTVPLVREGARTSIRVSASIAGYGASLIRLRVLRNSVEVGMAIGVTGSRGTQTTMNMEFIDNDLGTGSTVYTLQAATFNDGDYIARGVITQRAMSLEHIKR